jgi:hypothetical protein
MLRRVIASSVASVCLALAVGCGGDGDEPRDRAGGARSGRAWARPTPDCR